MACVCVQPPSLSSMSRGKRWAMFLVAMVETMLWSGNIFGWASLVHVLKVQGVYSNLCPFDQPTYTPTPMTGSLNATTSPTPMSYNKTVCAPQDDRMALMYTVACVVYSTPGIIIGYALHHLGLAFTRIFGGIMVSTGFVFLSLTSQATPDYLWGATILLAIGGNTIRMSGLQFGNLFPENRNTAMAIISGVFTPSAGILMVMQTMFEGGIAWHKICWLFACASFMVVALTPFMPRESIPVAMEPVNQDEHHEEKTKKTDSIKCSIFSVSSMLHAYWIFINMLGVTLFNTHFNTWINKFSHSEDEVALYSRIFGFANVLCVFITPLPGITMDILRRKFQKGKSGIMLQLAGLRAMILPMIVVSLSVTLQTTMLLFRAPWAVYLGLLCLMINRPSCLAVGNPFVRARFPAHHFNRLIGIQGTVLSLFTFIQYPHFTWAQHAYYLTFGVTVAAISLGLSLPLHLLNGNYLKRVIPDASN